VAIICMELSGNKCPVPALIMYEPCSSLSSKGRQLDKDRIKGSVNQTKGAIKEAVGDVTGDTKLKAEAAKDKAAGKVQNAIGGVKDAVRGGWH
jgi:uncharacterized protein YjbJ (UPF0337 family)